MTDKLREAAKAALYAMESIRVFVTSREQIKQPEGEDWYDNIINDLEAALAEPEQEPVAWLVTYGGLNEPLYTAPPRRGWVGLTKDEIAEIENEYIVDYRIPAGCSLNFAKDIEAKLREKNK